MTEPTYSWNGGVYFHPIRAFAAESGFYISEYGDLV